MPVLAGLPSPTQIGLSRDIMHSFQNDLLECYSDAELVCHIDKSPRLTPFSAISLLSTRYLAKTYVPEALEDSVRAVEVARQLGVRVPDIKRTIKSNDGAFCIMECIEGTTLEEAWAKLGWFASIKLAVQLRHAISLLRSVSSSTAGSLATGECRSFWLDDRYGVPARSSPDDITSFIKFWANFISIRQEIKNAPHCLVYSKVYTPPAARTFVFTHHDLAPRNILLDHSGQLWLIDWDYAGFYPPYFEYAAMHNFHIPQDWNMFARMRWHLFTWIAAGRTEKQRRLLERIRSKFTRFSVGRRFHLLANSIPTRKPVS
ncbi:kinase-like protein [Cucurbitaria berberidis CBS 394.84]|uniref:non-specific serine/threonine protein kinase n=1 Tax=Cucurbitaria berberidis CBS 394.84 TaxID=1168544 RepID=A0A9P4GMM9_9PLEO|nr:kinase-like protein [Cucurbitaria berberidis CBS 394.84]KAF1847825.1 kinase-like protein [Cucurbitaria berberidis CBS 394.84]